MFNNAMLLVGNGGSGGARAELPSFIPKGHDSKWPYEKRRLAIGEWRFSKSGTAAISSIFVNETLDAMQFHFVVRAVPEDVVGEEAKRMEQSVRQGRLWVELGSSSHRHVQTERVDSDVLGRRVTVVVSLGKTEQDFRRDFFEKAAGGINVHGWVRLIKGGPSE